MPVSFCTHSMSVYPHSSASSKVTMTGCAAYEELSTERGQQPLYEYGELRTKGRHQSCDVQLAMQQCEAYGNVSTDEYVSKEERL